MTRHWQNARTIANSEVRLRIRREPNATTIETQQRLQIARYVFVRCEPFFVLNTMLYLINCNLFGIEVSLYRARHRRKRSFWGGKGEEPRGSATKWRGVVESCHIAERCTAEEQQQREETQVPQNGGKKGESPRSWIAYWRRIATIEEFVAIIMQLSNYSKLRGFVRRIHKRIRSRICASIGRSVRGAVRRSVRGTVNLLSRSYD